MPCQLLPRATMCPTLPYMPVRKYFPTGCPCLFLVGRFHRITLKFDVIRGFKWYSQEVPFTCPVQPPPPLPCSQGYLSKLSPEDSLLSSHLRQPKVRPTRFADHTNNSVIVLV